MTTAVAEDFPMTVLPLETARPARSLTPMKRSAAEPKDIEPVLTPVAAPTDSVHVKVDTVVDRDEFLDVVRLCAAMAIVLVHSMRSTNANTWDNLFRFAVPFYLFASLYYQSLSRRRHPDRSLALELGVRAKRIYVPFLAWGAIYLLARNFKRYFLLKQGFVGFELPMLWGGTDYHLWFLPYLLTCSIAMSVMDRALHGPLKAFRWPAIIAAVSVGLVLCGLRMPSSWDEVYPSDTYTYVWWWRALPSTCFAMAFAWFMTGGKQVHRFSGPVAFAGLVLAIACVVKQAFEGLQALPRALSGLGCMLVALAPWRGIVVTKLAGVGRLGYGIYLSHVLFLEALQAIISRAGIRTTIATDLAIFGVSFIGSMLLVELLGRSKKTSWMNG